MSKEWNHYLDEITEADVEFEDIKRIIGSMKKDGIDPLDSEKVMTDLCSLRYRFGFFFMSLQSVYLVTRPKGCIHRSIRDISMAVKALKSLRSIMVEVSDEFESEEGEECDFCGKPKKGNKEESGEKEDRPGEGEQQGDNEE